MYCEKCGAKLDDNDLYCLNCGNKVNYDQGVNNLYRNYNNVNGNNISAKKYILPVSLTLVFLITASIIIFLIFANGGYKKTVDNYFKAHENNNAGLLASSVIAPYWLEYSESGWGEDALESTQGIIDDNIRDWGCGENIRITYEIKGERRANKEELQDLESNIYSWYAYYVYEREEFSVTDAYVLDIDFTVIGENGTEDFYYPDGFLIIKENGKWCVPVGSLNNSFYSNQ